MEYKTIPFEIKEIDASSGAFSGYCSVFNNIDAQNEVVMPGAFAKTLAERFGRVKVCWQHDWKAPIGKPLEIREDEHGLHVKAMISDTAVGRDVRTLMKDGVVSELSIGYDVIQDAWRDDNGKSVRMLKELRLYEISPVTMAANPMAVITGVKEENVGKDEKPFPNEHSCRLHSPGDFQADSFRRMTRNHEGKEYSVIMGKLTGESTMTEQAYRYPKDTWEAGAAQAHCTSHDGKFEAAKDFTLEELTTYEPAERLALCMALMDADPEMQVKEGRVLSGKSRGIIQAAMQALTELLAAAEPPMKPAEDEGKAEALTAQEYAALRVAVKCKLLELGYRPGIGG